ncbi:MAG: glutamine-hydrolyzing GMP synthase, partial [Candidatus Moranbacteria bacterium]|nr:glutamine-hydrolyzing GMP synthase [Candidatus Moranbacteria bacterium]
MKPIQILVVDMGSQYTLVIGRTLRELGFRSAVLSPGKTESWLKNNKPQAVILSGGSASVYEENSPQPPKNILKLGVPILGICYGMQWVSHKTGGKVVAHHARKEYGEAVVKFSTKDTLFRGIKSKNVVWASHGDSVEKVPAGFEIIARSEDGKVIEGMSSAAKKIWGVQFHPEVTHTREGKKILLNFLEKIARCEKDWQPADMVDDIRNETAKFAMDKKAIIGFSGGVDSTTLSDVLAPVFGKNLLAVCIDTGGLRRNELEEIKFNAEAAGAHLKIIKAANFFQKAIGKQTHSELKRKRFKKLYGKILEEEARRFKADFIVQGSLATDLIESGSAGKADLIKSHHNVGLNLKVKELHPFRNLFKYEVRELARSLKLPSSISERQPFPGPGLFIRIIGEPPRKDKLDIVRWADGEVSDILKKYKIYSDVSQLIVALDCQRTVGIKGDGRV